MQRNFKSVNEFSVRLKDTKDERRKEPMAVGAKIKGEGLDRCLSVSGCEEGR